MGIIYSLHMNIWNELGMLPGSNTYGGLLIVDNALSDEPRCSGGIRHYFSLRNDINIAKFGQVNPKSPFLTKTTHLD